LLFQQFPVGVTLVWRNAQSVHRPLNRPLHILCQIAEVFNLLFSATLGAFFFPHIFDNLAHLACSFRVLLSVPRALRHQRKVHIGGVRAVKIVH